MSTYVPFTDSIRTTRPSMASANRALRKYRFWIRATRGDWDHPWNDKAGLDLAWDNLHDDYFTESEALRLAQMAVSVMGYSRFQIIYVTADYDKRGKMIRRDVIVKDSHEYVKELRSAAA